MRDGAIVATHPPETDQDLVRRIQEGDLSAFTAIYERYRNWVVSLANRFCGNEADALDVLQETFSYFFRKLPTFELRSKMKTFLFPAVKHLALARKKAARRHAPLEHDVEEEETPKKSADIGHLIDVLPEAQKEVVWLRFVDGLDLKEIGETLGVPVGTVKSRLHTALNTIREKRRTF